MLIKKIDPNWYPSEKKDLKVGETIEFDNPRELIINGQAVAIVDGLEKTPYELYGVWTKVDEDGYKEYLAWKNLQALKEKERELAAQNEQLKEQIIEKAEEKPAVETKKK
jgi:hypothetical protein